MSKRRSNLRVMYIIAQATHTSVPLEVSSAIDCADIDLLVVAFKDSRGNLAADCDHTLIELSAQSFYDPWGLYNLLRCIAEFKPEVIHVHHTASSFWGALLGKTLAGSAVVRTEHSSQQRYRVPHNSIHTCVQFIADRILCNSQSTYRNLYPFQKWIIGDRWDIAYNGVNTDRIDTGSNRKTPFETKKTENRVLIGSVGRLVEPKNYDHLILGFSKVLEKCPNAHLILIGEGTKRNELESEASAQGIGDRVTFTGELSRNDVYAALHQFDLFIMPSLWEGFCNAVVEAMAAGCPVVCSDIRTLREVVGDVGEFVDPRSPDAIAQGIVGALQLDPKDREEWGQLCQQRAVNRYSVHRTAEAYTRTYFQVANREVPEELKGPGSLVEERTPTQDPSHA